MGTFYLKENDLSPAFTATLKDPDGTAHDLTGQTAKLHITLEGGTVLSKALTVTSATAGTVQYQWLAADWGSSGLVTGNHRIECEAFDSGGANRITFPNDGYDHLQILADFADGST